MNRWFNNKRWSNGRCSGCRWDRVYGIDWANFTGDPLELYNGQLPDTRIWETIRNDGGIAKGANGMLNYVWPNQDLNYFSIFRLKAYYPAYQDFTVDVGYTGFTSQRPPTVGDRNYGANIEIRDYSANYAYRAVVGRCFDDAYNGYIADTDTTSQTRFNFSPETSGAVRFERIGEELYASRWTGSNWYWNTGTGDTFPRLLRSDFGNIDCSIQIKFEGENLASMTSNMLDFVCTSPGLLRREDV